MIFLVFTLSLGIFSAKTARTLNTNNEDLIRHQVGADLVFAEVFRDNIPPPMADMPTEVPDRIIYTEPDFERFTGFTEVDSVTKVMISDVIMRRERLNFPDTIMMAIDTYSFGNTIWYRDDLLPIHINYFLNALALREDGVLLSMNFKTRYNLEVGERISYSDGYGNFASGMIIGFVEYWPGFSDRVGHLDSGGAIIFEDAFLMVTNLGHIHSMWGMYPYQVWMRTNTVSNRFFYEFWEENFMNLMLFEDAKANIVTSRNNPILQGTNGVLTAGFILIFIACFTGFLIYWTLSIKSRFLQFGFFRSMGMTKKNLISLLIYEQVFITFFAIGIGVMVGEIASRLFVPLIQIAYSPSLQTIPLRIIIETNDYLNIFSVVGLMVIICLIILGVLISRVKIAQALKLGED
jgi:putative ABC transport system permease protein